MPDFDYDDEKTFFEKHKVTAIVLIVGILGGIGFLTMNKGEKKPMIREQMQVVNIMPPPPPRSTPPPTPTPPPPQQQEPEDESEMMMQEAITEADLAEDDSSDEPPSDPIATGIVGDGPPDAFGLSRTGGGRIGGSRSAGQTTRYGRYAAMVQNRISDALRDNTRTQTAAMRVEVRIWPDDTGRITRAQLARSTGNPALDAAIRDEVLVGLRLAEPPPPDMPLPIVLRVTANRPM